MKKFCSQLLRMKISCQSQNVNKINKDFQAIQLRNQLLTINQLSNKSIYFFSSKNNKNIKNSFVKKTQTAPDQINKKQSNIQKQNSTNQQNKLNTQNKTNQSKSILSQQQKKELAFQQKLQATYTQLQSFPSDSYETVVQNFKRIKSKLNDRKVYVPNKPQLLTQLDNSLQFIRKHHKVWRAPSTATQRKFSDSKSEIIEWELQQAKKKYYLSLLEDQRVLIGIASGIIIVFGLAQYHNFIKEQDKTQKIPKLYL